MTRHDTALHIAVLGTPAPQGSKRHVGGGRMVESSKAVGPWRHDVALAALAAREATGHQTLLDAVTIHATFYLRRPRGHFRTGKNAHLLRDGAPAYPMTKPDLDKLVRSTLDALTSAQVYRDDAQVVRLSIGKAYADDGRPTGADLSVFPRLYP